ncbi:MAG: N-acetylmuramoyl-L-alanine amidase [Cyclobacteriaceae bacterium]|nr:N-acetylmuramoyl-L-alanine amidase [Cyclobacteriaceae bacterium]
MSVRTLVILLFLKICNSSSGFAQVDDDLDVVQLREGIYELLLRHDLSPQKYRQTFLDLNKTRLNGDTTLIAGALYRIPEIPEMKSEAPSRVSEIMDPLYGKKYERIPLIDHTLDGATYYLVSGHGGPDPGALGTYGGYTLSEDEYAYDVTLRLARNLTSRGATVYMIVQDKNDGIRDEAILKMNKDEKTMSGQVIPLNQKERLKQRADEVNSLFLKNKDAYQRLIEIHIDSRSHGENIDVFFYHHENSTKGKALAAEIHKVFEAKYARHQPNRPYHGTVSERSSLYMIKNTLPPMVFIELGNIRNFRDQQRFVVVDNRQALANWIELGVVNDFKKSK